MNRIHVPLGTSILIVLSLLLAACSSQTPTAAPTVDTNLVYTQAAQTVQAGLNATASARPPATATPEPTATPQPTATQPAPAGDAQATPTLAVTPTLAQTPVVQATNTPVTGAQPPAQPPSGDNCQWVDQSPKDGTQVKKDASWDMTIVVKNSGTTTWDKTYALKFWGGDRLGSPNDFYLTNEVKPGEMYRFVFTMKAPSDTGKKQANWVIQNGSGVNFCPLFLQVEVVN